MTYADSLHVISREQNIKRAKSIKHKNHFTNSAPAITYADDDGYASEFEFEMLACEVEDRINRKAQKWK